MSRLKIFSAIWTAVLPEEQKWQLHNKEPCISPLHERISLSKDCLHMKEPWLEALTILVKPYFITTTPSDT